MYVTKYFEKNDKKGLKCMICLEYKNSNIISCSTCKSGNVCNECIKQNYLVNKKNLLKCQQCGTYSAKLIYYQPYINNISVVMIKILYSIYLSLNIINIINSKKNILEMSLLFLKTYMILHIINILVIKLHNLKFSQYKWNRKILMNNVMYYSSIVIISFYCGTYDCNNKIMNHFKNALIYIITVFSSFYMNYINQRFKITQRNSAIMSRRI
jgi:hypothetical protein